MSLQRKNLINKELDDILIEINAKHGKTKGNSLIAREMVRIYNKLFSKDIILNVKKEAAIRVLCGQVNRENPLKNLDLSSKIK